MEAGPPYLPSVGDPYVIFRWSGFGTYGSKPQGPTWKTVHREWGDIVTVQEIENCLRHLDMIGAQREQFWDIVDHVDTLIPPEEKPKILGPIELAPAPVDEKNKK
jgi:hypothetical protein